MTLPPPQDRRPSLVDEELEPHPVSNFNPGLVKALSLLIVVGVLFATWRLANPSTASAWYDNVDQALEQAAQTQKPILVYFTADWCPPCQQFKKDVLSQGDVQRRLSSGFVLVKIDLSQQGGESGQIAQRLGVRSIPTFILYDANGNHIDTKAGGMDAPFFQQWLSTAE